MTTPTNILPASNHRAEIRSKAMDALVEKYFAKEHPAQREIIEEGSKAGLPAIHVGPFEGQLLEILLRSHSCKRGVEVGTLGGYSASWILKALPSDGELISIEKDPPRAALAEKLLNRFKEKSGVTAKFQIEIGSGDEVLKRLNHLKDLDFVFIDADKGGYGSYVEWSIPRLKKGGLILCDNAYIWGGMAHFRKSDSELDFSKDTPYSKNEFKGMSECWTQLCEHPELRSIILPTGEGLGLAVKI